MYFVGNPMYYAEQPVHYVGKITYYTGSSDSNKRFSFSRPDGHTPKGCFSITVYLCSKISG